jgi:predicted  nucleic acid-binding Zn-ribbon protein
MYSEPVITTVSELATAMFSRLLSAMTQCVVYSAVVVTVSFAALFAIAYYEHESTSLTEDNQAKLSQGKKNSKIALEQSEKKGSAHVEFRDALCTELSRTRVQRDRAEGGMLYLRQELEEARVKNKSKEDEAFDLQIQIQFKAKELQRMTLALENTKKELERANKFSQEAQDGIDKQQATITLKEKIAKGLLEQVKSLKKEYRAVNTDIQRTNYTWTLVNDELVEKLLSSLEEIEHLQMTIETWARNTAGTIHAIQSRVNELEGELAESKEENENLARDLKVMVERVEDYMKDIEALNRDNEQREWDVVSGQREDVADGNEEEEEEHEQEEDRSWALDGDSDDDATVYELDEDSEEEIPEWYIHAPTDTKGLPYKQMREDALRMREMIKAEAEELNEWNEDDESMVNNESENEDLEEQITEGDIPAPSENESEHHHASDDDSEVNHEGEGNDPDPWAIDL